MIVVFLPDQSCFPGRVFCFSVFVFLQKEGVSLESDVSLYSHKLIVPLIKLLLIYSYTKIILHLYIYHKINGCPVYIHK